MIYIGMDVHQSSTTFCFLDPAMENAGRCRTVTQPTTAEAIEEVPALMTGIRDLKMARAPFERRCQVVFEVDTQAQWIARIVQPLSGEVQVANAGCTPRLFRDSRKNR